MRSLSEVAESYERWATENDRVVAAIMDSVDRLPPTAREQQLRRASLLDDEAQNFRGHAARLRSSGPDRLLHGVTPLSRRSSG
jgi:hypothetical protein